MKTDSEEESKSKLKSKSFVGSYNLIDLNTRSNKRNSIGSVYTSGRDSPFKIPSAQRTKSKFKPKASPFVIEWRRATYVDLRRIADLQNLTGHIANLLFRHHDLETLIEKSYFTIVQFDAKDKMISFSALDPYPNIPSVPCSCWPDWISANYRIMKTNSKNTLFIRYMLWEPQYDTKFLFHFLKTTFTEFMFLEYIIIVKPPKAILPEFYDTYFIPVLPDKYEQCNVNSIQSLYICLRYSVIDRTPIRIAFAGDFEGILNIINAEIGKNRTETSKQEEHAFYNFIYSNEKRTLICESNKFLSGVMILNTEIDLEDLGQTFDLGPFCGLKKQEEEASGFIQPRESFSLPLSSLSGVQKPPNFLISSEYLLRQMNWELSVNNAKPARSAVVEESPESNSTNSDVSGYSLFGWSSLFESSESIHSPYRISPSLTNADKNESKSGEIKGDIASPNISIRQMNEFVKFEGRPNAFLIEFFAVDAQVNEKLVGFDFLETAFKMIPDREYCIILTSTDLLPYSFMNVFFRVTPRPMSKRSGELYLCHKNSFLSSKIYVRNTEVKDLKSIENLLKLRANTENLCLDIRDSIESDATNLHSFVLTDDDNVVGVSLLDLEDYGDHFRQEYEIERFIPLHIHRMGQHSVLRLLILQPAYRNQVYFFVRDILRMAELAGIYYLGSKNMEYNLMSDVTSLVPIKPKEKGKLERPLIYPGREPNVTFNLHITTTKFSGLFKIHVNVIIVIVGASRTALSIMESLIYSPASPYLKYNNLFCVTPHEIKSDDTDFTKFDLIFPVRDNFSKHYVSMLALDTYVTFIYGVMTAINRTEKYIVINNKANLKYDYLILTCGLQYLSPTPRAKQTPMSKCKKSFRSSLSRFLYRNDSKKIKKPKQPSNMFIINTRRDAKNALQCIQRLLNKLKLPSQPDRKIIVYGHDLHVFLTIHALIKLGVPGEIILWVEPFPSGTCSVTLFNDYLVDQAVLNSLKNYKINHLSKFFLHDWSVTQDDCISSITFHSSIRQIIIPCLAFVPFCPKMVSEVTYNACSNAGLVYDGKLVINHNFRTNDDFIYAAGPFTKYARRYFAEERDHRFYNSREIGQMMAEIIRNKVDPTSGYGNEKRSDLVPELVAPLHLSCQLPEDFNFFFLRKPGKDLYLETAYNLTDYGEVLTTGDCQMKKGYGYFRLHICPEGFVESITCYTKDKIDCENLSSLYGLHEKLLNNLLMRYDLGLIPDFYAYFRQPWASALFHENFERLRGLNYTAFYKNAGAKGSFMDSVVAELNQNKWLPLPDVLRKMIEEEYVGSSIEESIKKNIMDFLEVYKQDLPCYATNSVLNRLLCDFKKGPIV